MNGLIELLGNLIVDYIKRDYEEEKVRLAYIGPPARIFIDNEYIELVKGSEYTLPRWISELLVRRHLGRMINGEVDHSTIARLSFNERRSWGQLKFEKLSGYFYTRIKAHIHYLKEKYKAIEDLDKLHEHAQVISSLITHTKNLHETRLNKIITLLGAPEYWPDAITALSEEEKQLYTILRSILDIFDKNIFEVDKHG